MNNKLPKTDVISIDNLDTYPWVLFGNGGYACLLIEECRKRGVRLPELIITRESSNEGLFNIPTISETNYIFSVSKLHVLGTDVYQIEMLNRITKFISSDVTIYDCSPSLWNKGNDNYFKNSVAETPYSIIIDSSPAEHVSNWLANLIALYENAGQEVRIYHPLQVISNIELSQAIDVYFWNGTLPIFSSLKMQLINLSKSFKFIECGFFPQKDYFYIDESGINSQRQLATDNLAWVSLEMREAISIKRNEFFSGIEASKDLGEYIFIPLQLTNDSNVQKHSRFTQGMQEFIAFIESLYPSENLVFKAHPKDKSVYQLKRGIFSNLDSRILILGASKVHGINSTVLFEAALAGKQVITEGECLLSHQSATQETVLAAILATQYHIDDIELAGVM